MNFLFYVRPLIVCVLISFLLTGCASVSVKDEQAINGGKTGPPACKPPVIYIKNFSTAGAQFNVDREGQELTQFKADTVNALAVELQKYFAKNLGPSSRFGSTAPLPHTGWLVEGEFVLVNQGSRALRATIGFGAGGTKLETKVRVYDLSNPGSGAFLVFETTGGSGAMPGAVTGLATGGILVAGAEAAAGSAKGLSSDSARTARMITARISDYMFHRGWISEDQQMSPKMEDADKESAEKKK